MMYDEVRDLIPEDWSTVTNGSVKKNDKIYYAYHDGPVFKTADNSDIGKPVGDRICVIRKNQMIIPKGYHKVKKGKVRLKDQVYNPTKKKFTEIIGNYGTEGMPVSSFMCVVRKRMPHKNGTLGVSFKSIVKRIKDDASD